LVDRKVCKSSYTLFNYKIGQSFYQLTHHMLMLTILIRAAIPALNTPVFIQNHIAADAFPELNKSNGGTQMKRDYGLSLWTFGDNISFEAKCKIAADIGVDGVEIQGDMTQDPISLRKILQDHKLKALSVTPIDADISSNDTAKRSEAVQYFLDMLYWAKALGSERICLHGKVGKTQVSDDYQLDWDRLVDSAKKIMEKAEQLDIEVVVEVLNRYESYQVTTAKEAVKLVETVSSPNLFLLLDAYHMNIEEQNPVQALRATADKLRVYHIADSNRQAIGDGHANLQEQVNTLCEIGYQGPIVMEMTASDSNHEEQDYLDSVTSYYKRSLRTLKTWESDF
jgi:D-psicose/D-tagatose/L-ribulose 3-epimerase